MGMPAARKRLRFRRDHRWSPDRMSDYIEDDLPQDERRRIERHTAECPECAQVLETLETLIVELQGVRDAAGVTVAESILRSVRARLDVPPAPQRS